MHHEANEWWMRTRGYENQCYVAFTHPNVGFVVDPKGNIAAKRDDETPGILVCDIDLSKAKDDNHIRDRRPELYQGITSLSPPTSH
jgi:predicted amidohydrolase